MKAGTNSKFRSPLNPGRPVAGSVNFISKNNLSPISPTENVVLSKQAASEIGPAHVDELLQNLPSSADPVKARQILTKFARKHPTIKTSQDLAHQLSHFKQFGWRMKNRRVESPEVRAILKSGLERLSPKTSRAALVSELLGHESQGSGVFKQRHEIELIQLGLTKGPPDQNFVAQIFETTRPLKLVNLASRIAKKLRPELYAEVHHQTQGLELTKRQEVREALLMEVLKNPEPVDLSAALDRVGVSQDPQEQDQTGILGELTPQSRKVWKQEFSRMTSSPKPLTRDLALAQVKQKILNSPMPCPPDLGILLLQAEPKENLAAQVITDYLSDDFGLRQNALALVEPVLSAGLKGVKLPILLNRALPQIPEIEQGQFIRSLAKSFLSEKEIGSNSQRATLNQEDLLWLLRSKVAKENKEPQTIAEIELEDNRLLIGNEELEVDLL